MTKRVITNCDQLRNLPNGTVVRDNNDGNVYQRNDVSWLQPGNENPAIAPEVELPATVLWHPVTGTGEQTIADRMAGIDVTEQLQIIAQSIEVAATGIASEHSGICHMVQRTANELYRLSDQLKKDSNRQTKISALDHGIAEYERRGSELMFDSLGKFLIDRGWTHYELE